MVVSMTLNLSSQLFFVNFHLVLAYELRVRSESRGHPIFPCLPYLRLRSENPGTARKVQSVPQLYFSDTSARTVDITVRNLDLRSSAQRP